MSDQDRHNNPEELQWTVTRRLPRTDYKVFSIYHNETIHPRTHKRQNYVVIDCPHWVNVIALTPQDEVVMIRQFRHGTGEITLEIPGGMIDAGEPPLEAAKRELQEETGFIAKEWVELGMVEPNPALQTNQCWTFLALDASPDGETNFDPGEVIQTELLPLSGVQSLIERREITHSLVVAAFYHLLVRAGGWCRP